MANLTLGSDAYPKNFGIKNLGLGNEISPKNFGENLLDKSFLFGNPLGIYGQVSDPSEVVTIYFPGYFMELAKDHPDTPYYQEQAKIARFYEAILATSSVDSMANAAEDIFGENAEMVGEIELPPEVEYVLASWLAVSEDQSSESLKGGAVEELIGKTEAYKTKLRNIAWKEEAIKNHPIFNLSPEVKDYLETKGIDIALIQSPGFLGASSEKDLKQLIGSLNKYQEEFKLKKDEIV
ncbi:MAG: hypothetical protein HRT47_06115 [Candidatus Caenarcaniphilales bacterium]|nr:hypothetical protein [Candidatus Caenarcaniphilales bacterium]